MSVILSTGGSPGHTQGGGLRGLARGVSRPRPWGVSQHAPRQTPTPGRLLLRTVCILLECILVPFWDRDAICFSRPFISIPQMEKLHHGIHLFKLSTFLSFSDLCRSFLGKGFAKLSELSLQLLLPSSLLQSLITL